MIHVYEFLIDPEDTEFGMKAISIVDKPAIQSEFIAFNEVKDRPKYIKLQDEYKRIVAGLALIPNKLIYRIDENGDEYLGYFSESTIEQIVEGFMKNAEQGTTKNINLQHSDNKVSAHLIESFILRTPEMVDAVKALGIEEARLGAWYVSYKFDNEEEFLNVLNNNFNGFSVEVFLARELKLNKINKNNVMAKINKFIEKFKTILHEFEIAKLEDVSIADGSGVLRYGEVGTPVLKITVAEDGTETQENVAQGEYIMEDGTTLVVDAQGNLLEVKQEVNPAPVTPENMAVSGDTEMSVSGNTEMAVSGDTPTVSGDTETVIEPIVEPIEEEIIPVADVTTKTLGEIVDITKDGEYYIKVVVANGNITEAEVNVEQNLVPSMDMAAVQKENAELKLKLAKPIAKPIFEFTEPKVETKTKQDLSKMSNLDLVKHRLGL